ncbi:MFS transporter [Nocardioides sp. GY 10127]|uniref:MFS transporter n=1 Tax=Nocardioides sp. GY 10127 TaxID=2569762 RepID=UPI0010A76A4C|nr:MFS transporter [Nocardioides sp. GY 10127]TIC78918.1 MFS transporter [Nocardioides sp. GY 10127]
MTEQHTVDQDDLGRHARARTAEGHVPAGVPRRGLADAVEPDPSRTRRHRPVLGFVAAAVALVAVFTASGSPIPLYETYRTQDGLSTSDLALATVVYLASVLVSLLVLGRVSDHLGRRPVALASVTLAALGCLALLDVQTLGDLALGRLLQGLACGFSTSAVAAYLLDLSPRGRAWIAPALVAGGPQVGITLGALLTGLFASYSPWPETGSYVLVVVLLVACLPLLALAPLGETRPGVWRSLRPRVALPHAVRPLLPAAVAVFLGTWALGGFYQAFSPTISATYLGTEDPFVGSLVFASFMITYGLGVPLTARLSPVRAQRVGIVVFTVAVAGIVVGLYVGSVVVVLVAGVVAGTGMGTGFTGSVQTLLPHVAPLERAGLMASVYLFSYAGAAVPSLVVGRLTGRFGLAELSWAYLGFAVLATAVVLWRTRSRAGA